MKLIDNWLLSVDNSLKGAGGNYCIVGFGGDADHGIINGQKSGSGNEN